MQLTEFFCFLLPKNKEKKLIKLFIIFFKKEKKKEITKKKKMSFTPKIADSAVEHYGTPYFYNGGELFVALLANAFSLTLAILFSNAVLATISSCSIDRVDTAWITFFCMLGILFVCLVALWHGKKYLMKFAHKVPFLHYEPFKHHKS